MVNEQMVPATRVTLRPKYRDVEVGDLLEEAAIAEPSPARSAGAEQKRPVGKEWPVKDSGCPLLVANFV